LQNVENVWGVVIQKGVKVNRLSGAESVTECYYNKVLLLLLARNSIF